MPHGLLGPAVKVGRGVFGRTSGFNRDRRNRLSPKLHHNSLCRNMGNALTIQQQERSNANDCRGCKCG